MVKIAPSILSADFSRLGSQIEIVEKTGVDYLHIDVMDGHFVPNITLGPAIVKDIKAKSKLFFDVHLMIEKPELFIEQFVAAGADLITVHVEACTHAHRVVQMIKSSGIKAGVALNPATPLEMVEYLLEDLDLVLLMTVNPGFGGQKFIPTVLPKIKQLSQTIAQRQLDIELQVDGGVNKDNASILVEHGANVLVAGSAIFGTNDIAAAVANLRGAATNKE